MPQVFVAGPASWTELIPLVALPAHLTGPGIATVPRTVVGQDEAGATIVAQPTAAGVSLICDDASGGSERHLNLMDGSGGRISIYLAASTTPPGPGLHHDAAVAALLSADGSPAPSPLEGGSRGSQPG